MLSRVLVALCCALLMLPLAAQDISTWHGDLVSTRAFVVDAAQLYELKRKQKVTLKALGTMSALEAVAQGKVEIVYTARAADPRTPIEQQLEFIPVAWDSMVLITHAKNPLTNLTMQQVKDLYAGKVKNWSGFGGAPRPINLYAVAGPNDGVEYSLRRLLFGNGSIIVAAGRWYINTKQLEDAVAIDPDAIAVTALSNIHVNAKVKTISIDGVVPSLATLEDASYPLALPLYIAARKESPGQASSLPYARKVLEFIENEPALEKALRAKNLLLASDAKLLAEGRPAAEQRIMAALGVTELGVSKPAGPPMPPAPVKNKDLNPMRYAKHLPIAERPEKAVPAAATSPDQNAMARSTAAAKLNACRPRPLCAPPAGADVKPAASTTPPT